MLGLENISAAANHRVGTGLCPVRAGQRPATTQQSLLRFGVCILIHGEEHGLRETFNYRDVTFIERGGNI
jgi:hypothetical protein